MHRFNGGGGGGGRGPFAPLLDTATLTFDPPLELTEAELLAVKVESEAPRQSVTNLGKLLLFGDGFIVADRFDSIRNPN